MKKTHIKFLFFFALLLSGTTLFSQVQFNMLSDYGTPIMDINSSGQGISLCGYYDFATNAITAAETGVIRTSSMNDNGDVFGLIEDSNGNPIGAVRKNGIWTPLAGTITLGEEDELYDISENGKWVVGQLGWTMELGSWGFIYNTETQEFRIMNSSLYQYGAAYAVNNQGIAVGWVEDLNTGARMPSIFMPDGSIVVIDPSEGVAGGINNEGKIVGSADGEAFIYDMSTQTLETFDAPQGAVEFAFSCISDNGIVVGFATYGMFTRLPFIYNPETDTAPVLLSDFLEDNEIDATGLDGAAYKISSDGNYIGGFSNGPASGANGWAVKLGESEDPEDAVEEYNAFAISCYPNPTQDIITFNSEKMIQSVEIYNLVGQKVISQDIINGSVQIAQLPAGVYMVKAITETGEMATLKVVKQ